MARGVGGGGRPAHAHGGLLRRVGSASKVQGEKRKKTNMRGLPVRGAKWTLEAGVNCHDNFSSGI